MVKHGWSTSSSNTAMPLTCPKCMLLSPDGAERCDCGYDFKLGRLPILPAAEGKKRHGCLTASLLCLIVVNSASALLCLSNVQHLFPSAPGWVTPVLLVLSLFNLGCSIALFQWKKWGFWGYCVSSVVGVPISLSLGVGIVQSMNAFSEFFCCTACSALAVRTRAGPRWNRESNL